LVALVVVAVEVVGEEVEAVVCLCFVSAREVEVVAVRVETLRKMLVVAAAAVVVIDMSVHADRSISSMVKMD
jgi:hypothetical protein